MNRIRIGIAIAMLVVISCTCWAEKFQAFVEGDPSKAFQVDVDIAKLRRSRRNTVIVENQMSIRDGVAELNAKSKHHEIGKSQEPLTAEEVVGGIRRWLQEHSVSSERRAKFERIADSCVLNPGDELSFATSLNNSGHRFNVWWLDLTVDDYTLRIRDRTISSRKLTSREVAEQGEFVKQLLKFRKKASVSRG